MIKMHYNLESTSTESIHYICSVGAALAIYEIYLKRFFNKPTFY